MKKFPFDRNYLKISLYAIFVIAAAIVLNKTLGDIDTFVTATKNVFGSLMRILTPFIYGFVIAYVINPLVRLVENKALSHIKPLKSDFLRRGLAIALSYVVVLGFLAWILIYLFPQLIDSVDKLVRSLQSTMYALNANGAAYFSRFGLEDILASFNDIFSTSYTPRDLLDFAIEPVQNIIAAIPSMLPKLYAGTLNLASSLVNAVLGLIISFYMLYDKERLAGIPKKLVYILLKPDAADRFMDWGARSNRVFERFIVGKSLDSLIVGVLFFICCKIFNIPYYTLLLSIIIGVTNMIPYFGPFIGAAPVIFIVLINDPVKALWVAVIILVLQQIDGNIIGPRILGQSTGLKPLGVIFAITLGGAMFGVAGMFFGVPLFAVLNMLFLNFIDKRYRMKRGEPPAEPEPPAET